MSMRTALLGVATAVLTASPVLAADLQVPPYAEGTYPYEQEYWAPPPRVVLVPPAPVVTEYPAPIIVQRPVVVVRPPVVVYQPVYTAPEYAYSYPVRRFGPWGYHRPYCCW